MYRADVFWTGQSANITLSGSYETYFKVWANRCDPPIPGSKPGDDDGCIGGNKGEQKEGNYNSEVSPVIHTANGNIVFSSYQLADNCTLAQTAYALGWSTGRITGAYGTGLAFFAPSDAPNGFLQNDCILPSDAAPAVEGVVLDYEVADGRTPAQTTAFLKEFTDLVHGAGKKAVLYIDPLNSSNTSKYTGIDSSNAHVISMMFDSMTLQLENQNHYAGALNIQDQFEQELAVLKGPTGQDPVDFRRLGITFELSCTSLADASTVRSLLLADHIPILVWWRNGENNPPSCTPDTGAVQQKISCIVDGACGH